MSTYITVTVLFNSGQKFWVRGEKVGPFVVHRTVRKLGDSRLPAWCVTHITSGRRAGAFEQRRLALDVARRLAVVRGADWDNVRDQSYVKAWPKTVRARCRRILKDAEAIK